VSGEARLHLQTTQICAKRVVRLVEAKQVALQPLAVLLAPAAEALGPPELADVAGVEVLLVAGVRRAARAQVALGCLQHQLLLLELLAEEITNVRGEKTKAKMNCFKIND